MNSWSQVAMMKELPLYLVGPLRLTYNTLGDGREEAMRVCWTANPMMTAMIDIMSQAMLENDYE